MNVATPSWSLVNNYDFRQPERVFFNPYNANEVWVTSFGNGLKLGLLSGPVRVNLLSFNGNRENEITSLHWVTANEDAGSMFEIERSNDGIYFERIGTLNGRNGTLNNYSFTDVVSAPVLYYRLRIKGITGNVFYSNIIAFRKDNEAIADIRLMNNPVLNNVNLQAIVQQAGTFQLTIYDRSGKKILQQHLPVEQGITQVNIPLPAACIPGIYFVRIQGMGLTRNIRFVVGKL
jgi:hypothetical protein